MIEHRTTGHAGHRVVPRTGTVTAGAAAALVLIGVSQIAAAPAFAQTVPCQSIDLRVAIAVASDATCAAGTISDGDFRGTWEAVEVDSATVYAFVIKQTGGTRSGFYKQSLESTVAGMFDDPDLIEWSSKIEDGHFEAQRFYLVERGGELPCIGFQRAGGTLQGSDAKSVTYGYACNLDGAEFFDADAVDLLANIRG